MTQPPFKRIWTFLPIYFDVGSFLPLRAAIKKTVSLPLTFVVIDDSAGKDPEINSLRDQSDIRVVDCAHNLGHQKAIVSALRSHLSHIADDDAVVTMDSDGQDKGDDFPRLLDELSRSPDKIVLAFRTRRSETWVFKGLYFVFKMMFHLLTGRVIRNGNFAAYSGATLKRFISRRTFDLCYSSSLINVGVPLALVGCERGERIAGESRMGFIKLILHGLRMMLPFYRQILVRVVVFLGATVGTVLFLRTT